MDPKFQSSFIPKGPTAPSSIVFKTKSPKQGTLFGLLSTLIFVLSLLAALGVFGYGYYLNSRIIKMGMDLDVARANLDPETIKEIVRLNARIVGTEKLLANHSVLSPFFDFLESKTVKTARFTQFSFSDTPEEGLSVSMRGQTRGYAALAYQADIFNKDKNIKSANFSSIDLDERGNVVFTVKLSIDPELVSYTRFLEAGQRISPVSPTVPIITSTPPNATTTPNVIPSN